MAEYIKREALREILDGWRDAHADVDDVHGCGLLEDVICEVDAQTAANVAPVVHSRWEHKIRDDGENIGICHNCKYPVDWFWGQAKYCPNCGAIMDGGDSE